MSQLESPKYIRIYWAYREHIRLCQNRLDFDRRNLETLARLFYYADRAIQPFLDGVQVIGTVTKKLRGD